jgi:hypothetical protein
MNFPISRRRVLRGILGSAAVTVALPMFDCFLNSNGTALASGAPMPIRFGTWFWGLGMDRSIYLPKRTGADFDYPEEIEALRPLKEHLNLFSNFRVMTDGHANLCHYTGWVGIRCGQVPTSRTDLPNESIDVTISDVMGYGTRFRSLQMAATGNPRDSYSFRSADAINPPQISAVELYQTVFGPEFQDPNSPNFTPDPKIMIRRSVLSAVLDDSRNLERKLGTSDRARLDEYFTAVRETEKRLELQLQKPPPALACRTPDKIAKDVPVGIDSVLVGDRHKLMTDVLVLALACNQTKVFNMLYSNSQSTITKLGNEKTHHVVTHEESVDEKLGYQVLNSWFLRRSMENFAYFVNAMAAVKEGDGTLLDHSLVFAHSDQDYAKVHSIDCIPMWTAGRAGGKIKTGLHIDGQGNEPVTRVGYTLMNVMGVPVGEWGGGSMKTSKVVPEILT